MHVVGFSSLKEVGGASASLQPASTGVLIFYVALVTVGKGDSYVTTWPGITTTAKGEESVRRTILGSGSLLPEKFSTARHRAGKWFWADASITRWNTGILALKAMVLGGNWAGQYKTWDQCK